MIAVVDNNLPLSLARRLAGLQSSIEVQHLVDLGLQHQSDESLRRRWRHDAIVWISRDEDFWLGSPKRWAVVWINCHNPRLAFLRDQVAPAIASRIPDLTPGSRLLVTEEMVSLI
jgi:predicted nuclease of predicted toxin-antitoxin system